ncbi:MAG: PQQ-dependent sugar dehydrogenase, partial [Betaproteobacteria bacterium]
MRPRVNPFFGAFLIILAGSPLAIQTQFSVSLLAAVPSGYVEETVATVDRPVAMAFLPDGRLLIGSQGSVATRQAKISMYKDGAVLATPYATVTDVFIASSETGLLGIAVDPNFSSNGFVYAFITVSSTNQVVRRFTTIGDIGTNPVNLVTGIPTAGTNHNGGGLLVFDNRLYVSVGENGNQDAAQMTNNRLGKILRFNVNGTVPSDNPFGAGNPVWSYGLRNSFRMALRPGSNQIIASENGPAGFDEINRIVPGGNYGWPIHMGYTNVPGFISPIWSSGAETGIVPTDLVFYNGTAMPEFSGQLFIAGFTDNAIYRATINAAGDALVGGLIPFVTSIDQPVDLEVGRDGALWYCSRAGAIKRVFRATTNVAPTADFTRSPSSGAPPLRVHVSGSASFDSDGRITNYHWDWGDGTAPRSGPTRVTSEHNYARAGNFTLTLTVTDDAGATASSTQQVVVSANNNNPPSAHIEEVSAYTGPAPLAVDFVGHGHDGDGDLLRYDWNFGDGSPVVTYTNINPDTNVFLAHTFMTTGNFVVGLTVTDGGGLSSTNTVEIVVTSGNGNGGSNLLTNPGFEQGGTGWSAIGTNPSIVTSPVHSGTRALGIAGSSAGQFSVEQTLPVSGGSAYDVSAWIKTDALAGGASIIVNWQDASRRNLSIDTITIVRGTNDWTQRFANIVSPPQAAWVRVSLRLVREPDNAGTAWFDDVGIAASN